MGKSETPIRDKTPEAYESGATEAKPPTAKLVKDENYSLADFNLARQRKEARREALRKELAHYEDVHREGVEITSKTVKKPSYQEPPVGYR